MAGLFTHPLVNIVVKKLWNYDSIDDFVMSELASAGMTREDVDMKQIYAYLAANVEYVNDTIDRKIEEALTLLNDKVDQRLAELEARIAVLENNNSSNGKNNKS